MKRWREVTGGKVNAIVEQDLQPIIPGIWEEAAATDSPGDDVVGGVVTRRKKWLITTEAFWARFTFAERVDIDIAAQHDPAAANAAKKKAAKIRVRVSDINRYPTVKLKANSVENFVRGLETDLVIAAGRADDILLTQAADSEAP